MVRVCGEVWDEAMSLKNGSKEIHHFVCFVVGVFLYHNRQIQSGVGEKEGRGGGFMRW